MVISSVEKKTIIDYVGEYLAKKQNISSFEAHKMIEQSSLKSKIDRAPTFIAHCNIEQLADLVIKDVELALM